MLTRKQHELLTFIHEKLEATGISPSFEEMKEALDLRSKSGIHRLITALEERGFIRRLAHRARALEVIKLPDAKATSKKPRSNIIEPNFKRRPEGLAGAVSGTDGVIEMPLWGKIAAGTPIEALQNHDRTVGFPASMLSSKEHYALEVAGDSMIEAGILDGDTVIIERADTAENGTIVVALVDDMEATLKKLRRKGASIALEAANPAYETRIFGPDRVKIQGRMVGLLRRY
ncbi:transcriptional repressor LexA [Emcibacter sp. SYSU 3D8]|uniref:transcriptional repressor LexA n=1 Tax=Emcibacter sp. SYSU 3D8 TaxID=3133969 RepID=UPI0031FE487B